MTLTQNELLKIVEWRYEQVRFYNHGTPDPLVDLKNLKDAVIALIKVMKETRKEVRKNAKKAS